MQLEDLLRVGPKLHEDALGRPYSWQIPDGLLAFIDAQVREGWRTLETGAGVSTVLFAMKGTSHVCVVPAEKEAERIVAFCAEHHISTEKLTFRIERSEHCLPRLNVSVFDLVLIDGAHGFPIPFLDWYYTADLLKVGGLLIIDDTHVWTGHVLKMFLAAEPEWRIEADFAPRSVVFRKHSEGGRGKNEWQQPYVVQQTIDFMFRLYPDHIWGLRQFAPEAFRQRMDWKFRSRYLARLAASRVLPRSLKQWLKKRYGL